MHAQACVEQMRLHLIIKTIGRPGPTPALFVTDTYIGNLGRIVIFTSLYMQSHTQKS